MAPTTIEQTERIRRLLERLEACPELLEAFLRFAETLVEKPSPKSGGSSHEHQSSSAR